MTGDATQRTVMGGGYRKGQTRWNISSDTISQRELVGFAKNSILRDCEAWKCLYPAGIPSRACYRMPLWIKLDTEPPIMYSRLEGSMTGCLHLCMRRRE